jgi:hypothetical protein
MMLLRPQECRKFFVDYAGDGAIRRLLRPASFNNLPDRICQLRSFIVIRPIWTSVFFDNQFREMCRGHISKRYFVSVYLVGPSGEGFRNEDTQNR